MAGTEKEFSGIVVGSVNGKIGDNSLSDLTIYGVNRFPEDIKELLLRIDELGRTEKRWPLGENWPFSTREFDWVEERNLDEGRELLKIFLLEAGRGDEIMLDPLTQGPFRAARKGEV